jgi:hypothetical protein
MKNFALTDARAKELIFDAFVSNPILPVRLLPTVGHLYFDDETQREKFQDRSLWSLNNAFTEVVKGLRTVPQQTSGLRIGRFFGRIIHRLDRHATIEESGPPPTTWEI